MPRLRFLFALALIALLGGVLSGGRFLTLAQGAIPDASSLPPVVQAWIEAANAAEGEALAALYTPEGVFEDVPSGTIARGPEQIAAFYNDLASQQRDLHSTLRAVHLTDDGAVVEYTTTSTDIATGRPLTIHGITVIEVEGDRIRRTADYYDVAGLLAQLGMLQMAESSPVATLAP
jgi:steroid delta-isomerase-like uncharacterized protein